MHEIPAACFQDTGLLLKIEYTADASVDLTVAAADESILTFLSQRGIGDPIGRNLIALHIVPEDFFDPWVEFVLRSQKSPDRAPCVRCGQAERLFTRLDQYYEPGGIWVTTLLETEPDGDYLLASFSCAERPVPDAGTGSGPTQAGRWVIDCIHQTVFLCRQAARLLGLGVRPMVVSLRRFLEVIHPGDLERFLGELDHIGESPQTFSSRIALSGGKILSLSTYAIPVFDRSGRLTQIVACSRDTFRVLPVPGGECAAEEIILPGKDPPESKDSLTHCYSRAFFWERIAALQRDGERNFCVVLLDVNGLRLINDVFGYKKGDLVLKELAAMTARVFSPGHHIARIDGDEFGVIAYGAERSAIEEKCKRIDEFCRDTNKRLLPLSVSWGSVCREETGGSVHEMVSLAKARMRNQKMLSEHSVRHQLIASMQEALALRNLETGDHLHRMRRMLAVMGERLRLPGHAFHKLLLFASMHDIGKIAVPDHVINKPGPLSESEWVIMRGHTNLGRRIALASRDLSVIADEILYHHEKWDGSGYHGKKGEEIPLLVQLLSVADAYDVMTSRRVYKVPVSHEEALAELARCRGSHFSPSAADLFLAAFSALTGEEMRLFAEDGQEFSHGGLPFSAPFK